MGRHPDTTRKLASHPLSTARELRLAPVINLPGIACSWPGLGCDRRLLAFSAHGWSDQAGEGTLDGTMRHRRLLESASSNSRASRGYHAGIMTMVLRLRTQCPLYPQERTCSASAPMSAKCQKQTFCSESWARCSMGWE